METTDTLKAIRDYVDKLDILPRQEVLRYVRGVYDGSQSVKRQYGLDREAVSRKEPPKQTGKTA
jgi:hypothetical protein